MFDQIQAGTIIIAVLAAVAFLALLWGLARIYRKVGPNDALVVFGFGGTNIVTGGGRVVWPMIQQAHQLSLELMSFDIAPKQDYYTSQGVAVMVEAVAQIKVKSDPESIRTAAEQFLTKASHESEALIKLVMEGHLRGIVGQLNVEQIVKEPEMVSEKVRNTCAEDLGKMGLELVSFTIREVKDKNAYIDNMGKPDTARIKRDADESDKKLRHWGQKWAEAERNYRRAKAEAYARYVDSSMLAEHKAARVNADVRDERYERDVYEALQRAELEKVRFLRAELSAHQTLANAERAEMDLTRTAPDPA